MRRLVPALLVALAPSLFAADSPAVPQALAALQHLKPRADQGPISWTAGPYQYDASGNIEGIGSEAYVYDKLGRLKSATLRGPDMTSQQTQSFDYDVYGNLTGTAKLGQTVSLPTSVLTNRLSALQYDASGSVTTSGTQTYSYDAVGMLNTVHIGAAAQPRIIYAYTADDERLFAYDVSTSTTHWTLRGFDNKVLRDFKQTGSTWSVDRDYIYRDGLLLAALKASGAVEHYTVDHLGTPRLVTDASGHKIGYHVYWPFGEEWSPGTPQEASPLKFTGHERDADPTGGSAPLDYMHARYYGAGWGRFLAVDPRLDPQRAMSRPQMWNRFSYARNSPLADVDPDGREATTACQRASAALRPWADASLLVARAAGNAPAIGESSTQVAAALNLVTETLNLGTATGTALGMDQDSYDVGNAINSDFVAATEAFVAIGSIVEGGRSFGGLIRNELRTEAVLRAAAEGRGNFGVGKASAKQANAIGEAWVGPEYRVASDGKTLISKDGLRQYRPPSYKPRLGRMQANFEARTGPSGSWESNGHLDVK